MLLILISETALHVACEKGNTEIVKTLLSLPNIDVNIMYDISSKNFHYVLIYRLKKFIFKTFMGF